MAGTAQSPGGHAHGPAAGADARWLSGALALILAFMAGEVIAGVAAHSLALISDAAPGEDCHAVRVHQEEFLSREYGITHATLQVDHAGLPTAPGLIQVSREEHCDDTHGPAYRPAAGGRAEAG